MFCNKCGSEIQGEATYCEKCGNYLKTLNHTKKIKKQSSIKKKLTILLGGVVAVCLGIFIYFSLFNGNDDAVTYEFYGDYACVIDCEEDAEKVVIPSKVKRDGKSYSVKKIGEEAFESCKKLESVKIPDSVTEIEMCAFIYCESLKSIKIPKGVKTIELGTFSGCESLESVKIPNGVTKIGSSAFYECKNLKSIEMPASLTEIGDEAFMYCEKLTSIKIPKSVKKIAHEAFYACIGLTSAELLCSEAETEGATFRECINLKKITVPAGLNVDELEIPSDCVVHVK